MSSLNRPYRRSTIQNFSSTMRLILLFALLAISFGVQSQQSPQAPQIPAKQNSNSAIKSKDETTQQKQNPANPSAAIKTITANNPKKEGSQNGNKANDEATEFGQIFDNRLKITDTLLAIFTFFLVVIGWWQGSKLKKTVGAMHDEFIASHRPKIILREAFCEDNETDHPINVKYTLVNVGETRARIVHSAVEVRFIPQQLTFGPEAAPSMRDGRNDLGNLFLEAGEEIELSHISDRHWRSNDNTRHAFAEPYYGVFFCGHLVYEDDRKVRRHTAFWRKYDLQASRFYFSKDTAWEQLDYSD